MPTRQKSKGVAPGRKATPKTETERNPIAAKPTLQAILRVRGARRQGARRLAPKEHHKYPSWSLARVEEELFKVLLQHPVQWPLSDLEHVLIKSLTIKNQSLDLQIVCKDHAELTVRVRGAKEGTLRRLVAELKAEELRAAAQAFLEAAKKMEATKDPDLDLPTKVA